MSHERWQRGARALRIWALCRHSEVATIAPGKPWQNGSIESFNATFRRECLDAELFAHLREGRIVIEQWRWEYNTQRPHSSLDYQTPAEFAVRARAAMKSESRSVARRPKLLVRRHPVFRTALQP